ncbi:InlB B-repeat-containing protein [Acholeplasma laidlawii]|uniref:InlB B-repeat-containing protein n=4 Tax=Acholeplasma laidlawii TaxID=2148 RepID=A9NGR3_ACHLI|nr:InlB B-repeat-containing protein [Acholeplasma laidlawii]ABX81543.1 hypothetical protein ACL_0930 [Acholeplasma laidlawii PG-8A]NWH11275.1 hypothetical protein [Acholeplasma laidlawii]NWH13315.1 hypothetical protein [Acholeplasma laidlawii]NWH14137.1 hypothetical protein [Acholeplasma laidlawii]OAN20326.1 hypothetical protein A2I99_01355 [Acholeplasma laidlawii]
MKKLRIVTVLLLILSAFVLVGCEDSIELAEDEVKVRESATSLAGKNYEDVVEQLEVWGFTNIKTEAVYDIFWGITKEGTTKSVKIGGSETFKSGDIYKKDVSIVVTYSMKASDDPTKQKYKITWQYDDGTIIKIEDVLWGVTPNYTGTIPSKKSTNELRYEFNGWSPVMTVVNGEQTYTAIFSEVANTFTISWKNDNGSILETDNDVMNGATPEYNGITPVKNETSQYSFEFIGWSPNVVPANDNTEYIAVFKETLKTYTITWVDSDDNVLQIDENVEYGIIPSFDGVVPVNEPTVAITYVFGGWSPGVQAVSGNQTYKTIIHEEKTKYTIAIDTKGGVLENTEIIFDYADTVYNLEEPRKNGFIFTGWSLENEPLIFPYTLLKNIQIVANYKELKPYELIWDFYTNISNSNSFIVNDSEGYIQFLSNDSNSQAIYNKEGAYGFYYNLNGYEFMIVMDLVNSQFSYVDKYNYYYERDFLYKSNSGNVSKKDYLFIEELFDSLTKGIEEGILITLSETYGKTFKISDFNENWDELLLLPNKYYKTYEMEVMDNIDVSLDIGYTPVGSYGRWGYQVYNGSLETIHYLEIEIAFVIITSDGYEKVHSEIIKYYTYLTPNDYDDKYMSILISKIVDTNGKSKFDALMITILDVSF